MTPKSGTALAAWTPSLDEVNGQNLVTRRVVERHPAWIKRVYAYPTGGGVAIPLAILSAVRICLAMLFRRHDGIYIVCSRSPVGFLRDFLPLSMSLFGYRVIVHVHGSDFPDLFKRRLIGRLARFLYINCEVMIPSSHLLSLLDDIKFRRLYVCENFASSPRNKPDGSNKRYFYPKSFTVLWNSNIMSSKGLRELVGGLSHLRAEGLTIRLIVLGTVIGDSEATVGEMSAFVASLASDDWVDVRGRVQPEEVETYLAVCDAIALPSTYASECQPLSVIQAMLAGKIILVAPTDALRATVGTYPAVFAQRSAKAIAAALRPYATGAVGTDKRIEKEIEVARQRFSPAAFDARIEQILAATSGEEADMKDASHDTNVTTRTN